MAKINSRSKGKRGEREVINKLIQPIVDKEYTRQGYHVPTIQRNLMQSDAGGYDLVGIDWAAIEVKFCETFQLKKWWSQTLDQANPSQLPILLYRKSRVPWRCITHGFLPIFSPDGNQDVIKTIVDISKSEFERWFACEVRRRLQHEILGNELKRANLPSYSQFGENTAPNESLWKK